MMDIGTKAKSLFLPSPLELGEKEDGFQKDCLNCMRLTKEDLQLTTFFRNCCYIQLQKKNYKNALESITCIAQDVTTKSLSQVLNLLPKRSMCFLTRRSM